MDTEEIPGSNVLVRTVLMLDRGKRYKRINIDANTIIIHD